METQQEKTEWDMYVEEAARAGVDLQAEANRNFRQLMGSLLDHYQSTVTPIWTLRDKEHRYFETDDLDQLAEANYNSALLGALADLIGYSVGTSKRIELMLAVFSLYKELEGRLTEEELPGFIVTRRMLGTEIEDAVSRIHNYREKVALCIDLRNKHPLKIERKQNSQGVGFNEVYKATRTQSETDELKRILAKRFRSKQVSRLLTLRHGVTHGISPAFERSNRPPRWELDVNGEAREVQDTADLSFEEAVTLINRVWRAFILGTEQLFKHEWI